MTLYDDVVAALAAVDGLTVTDPAAIAHSFAIPSAELSYGGHEQDGNRWLPKVNIAVNTAWAQDEHAHRTTLEVAVDVIAALDAMANARLTDVSAVLELARPGTDEVAALGFDATVIGA